jgi:hypothetical protein
VTSATPGPPQVAAAAAAGHSGGVSSSPERGPDADAAPAAPAPTDAATDLPPVVARTDSRRTTWRGAATPR